VLFKSSKLVPTMAMGTLMQGKQYGALEYLSAAALVMGVVFFTLGDAELRPGFHPFGVALVTAGVVADAATSNYEEREFFRVTPAASQPEVMTYSSMLGTLWALLALLPTDELGAAIAHSTSNTAVLPLLVSSAACGYVSVSFVLLMINLYGATVTELVKSLRKVLTVVLSFVLYPKPISPKYLIGGVCVLASLVATHELQRRKGGDVHNTKGTDAKEAAEHTEPLAAAPDADAPPDADEAVMAAAPSGSAKAELNSDALRAVL